VAAGDERFDRDAISDVDAPALGGAISDLLDDAERFVARDDRQGNRQHAGILLGVTAADSACFYSQQGAVRIDLGQRELPQLERTWRRLHDDSARLWHFVESSRRLALPLAHPKFARQLLALPFTFAFAFGFACAFA
jgi:hypothetical protein